MKTAPLVILPCTNSCNNSKAPVTPLAGNFFSLPDQARSQACMLRRAFFLLSHLKRLAINMNFTNDCGIL